MKKISFPKVIMGFFFSFVLFFLLTVWGGMKEVKSSLSEIPYFLYVWGILLILLGYVLRLIRWIYLLKKQKQDISLKESSIVFFMGMSMTMTPGKVGEFLKSYLLKQRIGSEVEKTMSVILLERMTDIFGMVFLIVVSVSFVSIGWVSVFFIVMAMIIVILLLSSSKIMTWIINQIFSYSYLKKFKEMMLNVYKNMKELLTFRSMVVSVFLSSVAWFLEGYVFYLLANELKTNINLIESVFSFSLGTIMGALSMMPGGIGASEGGMVVLLLHFGLDKGMAVALTTLIRLFTLWLGTLIGIGFFLKYKKQYKL